MSITVTGMDDLLKKLEKLSDKSKVDEIAKKAVDAAQPISERSMKSALAASEHGPKPTGSVAASVSSTKAKVNSYGVFAVARPTGRDKQGVRNGAKAAYLQYGGKNLSPRPWREKAASGAESQCIRIMENIVKQEMEP